MRRVRACLLLALTHALTAAMPPPPAEAGEKNGLSKLVHLDPYALCIQAHALPRNGESSCGPRPDPVRTCYVQPVTPTFTKDCAEAFRAWWRCVAKDCDDLHESDADE